MKFLYLIVFCFLSFQAFSQNDSKNQSQKQALKDSQKVELTKLSSKKNINKNTENQKEALSQVHSFHPLLIQGGKKIKDNTKNIKVDINSISETEVFFIETDFKKRIYLDEGHL